MGVCERCGQPNPANHATLEECLKAVLDRNAEVERIFDGAIEGWRKAVALRDDALNAIRKLSEDALHGPR
jgi:hypothetical protein